jgi:cardiolipin synthase
MSMRAFFDRSRRREWRGGHRAQLLENGEQYYPAVFDAIAGARHEVMIETFILFEDKVGLQLQRVLIDAAQRGVQVDLTVDGWGTPELSSSYVEALEAAGVRVRAFDPHPRFLGLRLHMFRRMHRKIVLVDASTAFIGGINFSADHLADFGPEAKQDYAVRLDGPLAWEMRAFFLAQIGQPQRPAPPAPAPRAAAEGVEAMFVTRDNRHRRDAIEREYRAAIRAARREIVIANAYFFPGYRLLRAMRQAARRGVRVCLILQGQPDMAIVKRAAELLHARLISAGVEIHEYCKRPLHGKVAVVDGLWSTVGSSNLDPLSLALNLEANVMIRDADFAAGLRERLEQLMHNDCKRLGLDDIQQQRAPWRLWLETLAYHVARHFPSWAGWLPAHAPVVKPIAAAPDAPPAVPAEAQAPEPVPERALADEEPVPDGGGAR